MCASQSRESVFSIRKRIRPFHQKLDSNCTLQLETSFTENWKFHINLRFHLLPSTLIILGIPIACIPISNLKTYPDLTTERKKKMDPYESGFSTLMKFEWFIEDQALSRSYDLAPRRPPTPPPLPSVSWTGDTQEDWERETTCLRERGEKWGGRGAESYERKKTCNTVWS